MIRIRVEELLYLKKDQFQCIDDMGTWSGRDLYDKVLSMQEKLLSKGIKKNDKVIMICDNSSLFIVAMLAILKTGGIVVPLLPQTTLSVLEEVINITCPNFVCVSGVQSERLMSYKSDNIIFLFEEKGDWYSLKSSNYIFTDADLGDEDIAFILMSSGTTGARKGIALSHRAIINNVKAIVDYMKPTENERFLILKNMSHASTLVGEILVGLYVGVKIYAQNPIALPSKTLKKILEYNPTIMFTNPSILVSLGNYLEKRNIPIDVPKIYTSGAVFRESEALRLSKVFSKSHILNVYGLTEAGPRVTAQTTKNRIVYGSVGKPIMDTELFIKNENGDCCKTNEVGSVFVKNNSLMSGYIQENGILNAIIKDGILDTGDLGYIDEAGEVFIIGRKNEIINVLGNNVNPTLVENRILLNHKIKDCAIFGVFDELYGSRIICLIICKADEELLEREIVTHCNEWLLPFERPKEFYRCDSIPVLETGKRSRKYLKECYEKQTLEVAKLNY